MEMILLLGQTRNCARARVYVCTRRAHIKQGSNEQQTLPLCYKVTFTGYKCVLAFEWQSVPQLT